jgi:hypothetical protein
MSCPEAKKCTKEYRIKKWVDVNKEAVYKEILSCTNQTFIKGLRMYLGTVKITWKKIAHLPDGEMVTTV